MSDEKKTRYTQAQKKAAEKYFAEKVETLQIRVPKCQKAILKAHADRMSESLNAFVVRAISEAMERDN